jgi:hypothetical protein
MNRRNRFAWTRWRGMPEFAHENQAPKRTIRISFPTVEDLDAFENLVGQKIDRYEKRTPSFWYPEAEIGRYGNKGWVLDPDVEATQGPILPRYPIYIPSKGRWETRHTIKHLEAMGIPYFMVVEPQEAEKYARHVPEAQILVTPHRDKGVVATRNFFWDHAASIGAKRFWNIDDNINGFYRFNHNLKVSVHTGAYFRAMEDFVDRHENLVIAGPHYFMFASRKVPSPPFYYNTRVYSCMLIETNARNRRGEPFRFEGFYNEDTELCLRVLKAGHATLLFNAFLINKIITMRVKGGNTPNYQGDGRLKMARELKLRHPDVVRVIQKWGRWQHQVDYRSFRSNPLVLKPEIEVPQGVNNYGMVLRVDGEIVR